MIKHFAVSNYKNFNSRIDFDVTNEGMVAGPLLIYGKNGVGKTNLAKALFDIRFLVEGNPVQGVCCNADSHNECMQFEYTFCFDHSTVQYSYTRDDDWKFYAERLTIDNFIIFDYTRDTDIVVFHTRQSDMIHPVVFENYSSNGNASLSFLKYIITGTTLTNNTPIKELLADINGMFLMCGTFGKINQECFTNYLAKDSTLLYKFQQFILNFNFTERIFINNSSAEPILEIEHARPLPFFEYASAGLTAVAKLFYTLYCRRVPLRFVFLDEFDAAYHYQLSKLILKHLGSIQSQVIVTTHNVALLQLVEYKNIAILDNGTIQPITHLTNRDLSLGFNLEQLYRAGEFDNA